MFYNIFIFWDINFYSIVSLSYSFIIIFLNLESYFTGQQVIISLFARPYYQKVSWMGVEKDQSGGDQVLWLKTKDND